MERITVMTSITRTTLEIQFQALPEITHPMSVKLETRFPRKERDESQELSCG
jgi:hypothetical protein